MKKRLALLCICVFLVNALLTSFGSLWETSVAEAADSAGLVTPGRSIGSGEDSPFGLNVQAAARYAIPGQLQVALESAKGTGAAWDREEIRWNLVQKADNSFNFSLMDEMYEKAKARGLNVLGLLVYNRDNSKTMPDLNAWSNYVSNTVGHFKGKINYWQVWNEPENSDYLVGANPADYARLLKASYAAVKGANPEAKVLTAGVNGFAVAWMEKMLAAGGEGQYDILAVHPYVLFNTSPEAKYWADNQVAYFMSLSRRHGNKPVWATEFGWTTANDPNQAVSETAQANYLARSYVTGLSSGLSKMLIYQFRDEGTADNYGLVRKDWITPKPSYTAYKNLVTRLTGATYKDKVDLFDNTRQAVENFEAGKEWGSFNTDNTSSNLSLVSDLTHGGSKSLKVAYGLNGGPFIELGPKGGPIAISGQPTKIGTWIYGDDTGTQIRLVVQGSDGQQFHFEPGKVGGKSWHRLEAFLAYGDVFHNGDGVLKFPVKLQSIILTRQPAEDEPTWNGTLYFDDIYAEGGANVQLYRFDKAGRTLDVVWSDGDGAALNLPTQSSQGEVKAYNRDGGNASVSVSNGAINFSAGDDMIFIEHTAPPLGATTTPAPSPTPTPGGGTTSPIAVAGCGVASVTVTPGTSFSDTLFQNFWLRYDALAPGNRSFVWGGQPVAAGTEPYSQSPGGSRKVLYFDKSRMEISNPNGNPNADGFITNGLLTVELLTGKVQLGDDQANSQQFRQCTPSSVPVAGDNDDTNGPKYTSLATRLNDPAKAVGAPITESIDAAGKLGTASNISQYNAVGGYFEPSSNHTIAKPFWDFLNDANQKILVNGQQRTGKLFDPYYVAPGLPITEAYWARVKIGGEVKDVLVQAFERRVLTYTPSNTPAFRVEWGNIGRHYYSWRYGVNP